jgi:hypothetical protein
VQQGKLIQQSRFADAGLTDYVDNTNGVQAFELIFQDRQLMGATPLSGCAPALPPLRS